MGLMDTVGMMAEVSKVFTFIRSLYYSFPLVVQLVILGAFGSVIFIGILRGVGR